MKNMKVTKYQINSIQFNLFAYNTNIQYEGKANILLRMLYRSKKTYSHARLLRKLEKSIFS